MTRSASSCASLAVAVLASVPAVLACRSPAEPAAQAPQLIVRRGPPSGPGDFQLVAERGTAGVVNIATSRVARGRAGADGAAGLGDELLERLLGPRVPEQTVSNVGSGFIVGAGGEVLTNAHVIEGAEQIAIELVNGARYPARLVGQDARTDVALLQFRPREALTVLELGDSDQARVGEWVMAIGNPFGLSGSATVGVISFRGRPLTLGTPGTRVNMLQTDASINPGNSGGPLLDMEGRVIGINTLIVTPGLPQSAGVGFAVPINVAKEILPALRKNGRVARGWLGVQLQPMSGALARSLDLSEAQGALVSDVVPGGPADATGMVPGDVIIGLDGAPVGDPGALNRAMASMAPGRGVELRLWSAGEARTVTAVLEAFPEQRPRVRETAVPAGRLGLALHTLTPYVASRLGLPLASSGLLVVTVQPGSAAAAGGLRRGDIIVSADGRPVPNPERFARALSGARSRGVVRLRLQRAGAYLFTALTPI